MLENLFNRYKTLLRKSEFEAEDPVFNKIYLALHQLQRGRSFIEIVVEGDEAIYQSMILSLDPDERTILIDELFPTGFLGVAGQRVHVSVRQKAGRKLKFPTVILERHSQNDTPLYVLQMPASLDLDQRRNAFRLPISTQSAIDSSFTAPDCQTYNGKLRNLSSSGVCIEIEGGDAEPLNYGDHLTDVDFAFAGKHIGCELAVRSIFALEDEEEKTGKNNWVIGAEFIDLPSVEQRVLEKTIMRIQRDRIKYAGDMEIQQAIA